MLINDVLNISSLSLANFVANAAIGTAAATVDIASQAVITQTTAGISVTIPSPTTPDAGTSPRFAVVNATASTQSITVAGIVLIPGSYIVFAWDGAAWVTSKPQTGIRNQGASVTVATIASGNTTVAHNLSLPSGSFSSVIVRAYNTAGNEVVFKRNKAADTANVIGISSPIAIATSTVFDIISLA